MIPVMLYKLILVKLTVSAGKLDLIQNLCYLLLKKDFIVSKMKLYNSKTAFVQGGPVYLIKNLFVEFRSQCAIPVLK